MPRGLHAADGGERLTFTPSVEFANFLPSFEAVVAHAHHAVGRIKFMGAAPAVAVDLVPISRLQVIKRVPKAELLARVHMHLLSPTGALRLLNEADAGAKEADLAQSASYPCIAALIAAILSAGTTTAPWRSACTRSPLLTAMPCTVTSMPKSTTCT